jgi:omega-6 fatty acid desaturase (delta-12 desaturase)
MAERPANTADAVPDARAWIGILATYREPSSRRSITELVITAVPFLLFWALAWACLAVSYWASFAFIVLAAGFLVRLFVLQHDCGHGSFFRSRRANDWVGRVLSVFTLTPYDVWRRDHAIHHAGSGNLEKRGTGDIDTLTVREYRALSRVKRLRYRIYRHPIVLFVLGPAYQFFVRHRWPLGKLSNHLGSWRSTMITNAAIALLAGVMIWLVGPIPFFLIHLPITLIASSVGVWLFYVQHQFEETTWSEAPNWDLHEAALHGSSHYDLPGVLRWITANIGAHHIHHLCSRIPSYRLPEVLKDHPLLASYGRITLMESLRCVRLSLWDEQRARLVSFKDVALQA